MAVPCCGSSQGRWALKTFPLPHRRERSKVPYIVRQCVEEIERRGMEEVGIYRVSGVATDIQALKAAFDVSECLPGKYGIGVWARCWLSGCPPWPVPVISLSTLSLHLLFYHILNERQRELWEEVTWASYALNQESLPSWPMSPNLPIQLCCFHPRPFP